MEITSKQKEIKLKEEMSRTELIEEIQRLEYYIEANLERSKMDRAFSLQTQQIRLIKFYNKN